MPSCESLVFLLTVSVISTTLSLSALSGLRNHTRNDSSATLSALFLTRSPAAPALLYQPQTNSAAVILWVCTRRPSLRLKWIAQQGKSNKTRLQCLSEPSQKKRSDDTVKGFCICIIQKDKDDKRNKHWKWACFCWGEWLMNMSCFLHTSS